VILLTFVLSGESYHQLSYNTYLDVKGL